MAANRVYLELSSVIVDLQAGMLYRCDGYLLAPCSVEDIRPAFLPGLIASTRDKDSH